MRWSIEEVIALADAMDQLLDDMGSTGKCVCLHAKAQARIAFEPFRNYDDHTDEFTLEEARQIVEGTQQYYRSRV